LTLNLSQVNTVTDLVNQNNEPTPPNTSQLDALTENLDLNETYELALKLVQRLGSFHQSVLQDLSEETPVNTERLIVWSADESKLHTCWNLLNEVYNND